MACVCLRVLTNTPGCTGVGSTEHSQVTRGEWGAWWATAALAGLPEAKVQGDLRPGTSLGQLLENLQNVPDARVELGDQVALMTSCRV